MNPGHDSAVRIFPDLEELSQAAARYLVSHSRKATAARGKFTVALSGGSSPKRLYSLLATGPYVAQINWSGAHFFWADERCVPPDHEESNFRLAHDAFLAKVLLPKENTHRIAGEEDPERAASEYEQHLRTFFDDARSFPLFDLILLGVGEDGHTASLFPGAATLRERVRIAVPVYSDAPKPNRVTLTLPVLNHASHILFLVSGRGKAKVLHEIFEDGNPKQYPAGMVRPVNGTVTWMIDRDAASLLSERSRVES